MIDATHWEKLRGMDPQDVVRRALAEYDKSAGEFILRLAGDDLRISPERRTVVWSSPDRRAGKGPGFHYWLVSVVYLISAKAQAPTGEWVAPMSLPYGDFFFRGPHALPSEPIARAFGDEPERFARAARQLGGRPWAQGWNAFEMPALPRVPILVQLWERDEEFPARANFLFDRTACDHLAVDAVFSLTIILAERLVEIGSAV